MLISRSSDYALRALLYLARKSGKEIVTLREISEEQRIPPALLSKLLHNLSTNRFLRSTRGIHGGYQLLKPASEITIRDVVEVIDGPPLVFECLDHSELCHLDGNCTLQVLFSRAQQAMLEVLGEATLLDMQPNSSRSGDKVPTP